MVKKTKMLLAAGIYITTLYGFNAAFCIYKSHSYSVQKEKSTAYKEYKKLLPELNYYQKPLQDYKEFLSDSSKSYLEKKVNTLTEKKLVLEKKIKPYDEQKKKWFDRAVNPLRYSKFLDKKIKPD